MCLWANYIFPGSHINLQHKECGNWDWARVIPFLGIFFRIFGIASLQRNKYNGLSTGRSWWLWATGRAVRPAYSSSSAETSSPRYQTHPAINSGSATGPHATKNIALQARSQHVSLLFSVLEASTRSSPFLASGNFRKNAPKKNTELNFALLQTHRVV